MTRYYAHSLAGRPEEHWQPLEEHLHNTAELAAEFARHFSAAELGRLCGRWHDLGKFTPEFQRRLRGGRAHVDHKTHGARQAVEACGPQLGMLLAYVLAGHHGGLPDGKAVPPSDLKSLLQPEGRPRLRDVPPQLLSAPRLEPPPLRACPERLGFQVAFFIRMLYSALVDADFLDTERFMDPERFALRRPGPTLESLRETLRAHLADVCREAKATEVNARRREILDACLAAADWEPGLFSLSVPTGGGKTLSSLAFALEHARRYGLRRVIYVIPYTSIIEQNARVFRKILGAEAVLEHHSNFFPETRSEAEEDTDAYKRARLCAENWDAPLVVTTNVQFFESLFANKSSRCRKLHNLAKSVIILDEAQMLPLPYLRPCLEALEELRRPLYGASVVFCTATQPNLSREDFQFGLPNVREIMPDPAGLAVAFERVRLTDCGTLDESDLAERLAGHEQVLCVVNTRKRAASLFQLLRGLPGIRHLSARMCPRHRRQVLEEIRATLKTGQPCRVVSTQLIEAGVDIDFPIIYRELAGLDSLAQAAGRCNREGSLPMGQAFVFRFPEQVPQLFRLAAAAAEQTLRRFPGAPFSPAAVRDFFSGYYWLKGDEQLDAKKILHPYLEETLARRLDFPFAETAAAFKLIENDMLPVIVPWDPEGAQLVQDLRAARFPGETLRRLQGYTVQVFQKEYSALRAAGSLELVQERHAVLIRPEAYDPEFGLRVEEALGKDSDFFL